MFVAENLLEVFQNYFGETCFGILLILSMTYILIRKKKYQKIMLIGLGLLFLIVFNPLVYKLFGYLGEGSTYYRMMWMIPVPLIVAYVITDVNLHLKEKKSGWLLIVSLLLIVLLDKGTSFPEITIYEAANKYNVAPDVLQISEVISSDYQETNDDRGEQMLENRAMLPWNIYIQYRSYDASISYAVYRDVYLYGTENRAEQVLLNVVENGAHEDVEEVRTSLQALSVRYLVISIAHNMNAYLEEVGCSVIGYTDNYIVYRVRD